MKYVFTIDMDGTLLNDASKLSNKTIDVIKKYKDQHHFILASGRSYLGMIDFYQELGLTTPIISLNGALITYPDGKTSLTYLPKDEVTEIITSLKGIYEAIIFNGLNNVYSINHDNHLEKVFNGAKHPSVIDLTKLKHIPEDIINGVIVTRVHKMRQFEAFFDELTIKPRSWGHDGTYAFYDLYLEGISKASALNTVLKDLDYKLVYTFGDGMNDLEMIKLSPNGVVMKNGHPNLKKAATKVTAYTNDEDGVAKYIENLLK